MRGLSVVALARVLGEKADMADHDNYHHNNIYAYLFPVCYVDLGGGEVNNRSHINHFENNTCIQAMDTASYAGVNCKSNETYLPVFGNNQVYNPSGKTGMCGFTLKQWQAQGNDLGTQVHKGFPSDPAVIAMARTALGLKAM